MPHKGLGAGGLRRPKPGEHGKPPRKIYGPEVLTSHNRKPPGHKADVFAGKGSVAGKLKKRREDIESGDARAGRPVPGKRKSNHN